MIILRLGFQEGEKWQQREILAVTAHQLTSLKSAPGNSRQLLFGLSTQIVENFQCASKKLSK